MGNESVARCEPDAEPAGDYAAVFTRIEAKIPALVEEGQRLLQEAEGLLAQLLRRPMPRRWQVIERPGFARPALVYLLLDASEARLRQAPAEAGNLAQLAARLAFRLEPALRQMAPEAVQAFCLMGNARRQTGDFAMAELAFERANLLALDDADRGRCCRGLGLLRWEQGRADEGLELLERSVLHFGTADDAAEAGTSQALLGLCLVGREHPR
jgi:tetratricopeptide (TPR) repeat protein